MRKTYRDQIIIATFVLLVISSHLGMIIQAYLYSEYGRGYHFFITPDVFFGVIAVSLFFLSIRRISLKKDFSIWLFFLFIGSSLIGEFTKSEFRASEAIGFLTILFYLIVGYSVASVAYKRKELPATKYLLLIYTVWYTSLFLFFLNGQLGFFSELEGGTYSTRLTFIQGYTSTEIVIWAGFHLPVVLYVLNNTPSIIKRSIAVVIVLCVITLVITTLSSAAIIAIILVFGISYLSNSKRYLYLSIIAFPLIVASLAILNIQNLEIFSSSLGKINSFSNGSGTRFNVYNDLLNTIYENPFGVGRGRYVEINNLSYLGEGVYPHNNFLGIGAELGVISLILYMSFIIFIIFSHIKVLFFNIHISKQLRLLISLSLCVLVYQQFRGIFHDTWTMKETYLWAGLGLGIVSELHKHSVTKRFH